MYKRSVKDDKDLMVDKDITDVKDVRKMLHNQQVKDRQNDVKDAKDINCCSKYYATASKSL